MLAVALTVASEAAYAAVGTPVEGTILTVARAAAEAAVGRAEDERARARDVFAAAAQAAREACTFKAPNAGKPLGCASDPRPNTIA